MKYSLIVALLLSSLLAQAKPPSQRTVHTRSAKSVGDLCDGALFKTDGQDRIVTNTQSLACLNYIGAAIDGLTLQPTTIVNGKSWFIGPPEDQELSLDHAARVFVAFVKAHPEKEQQPAITVLQDALLDAHLWIMEPWK